MGWKIGNADALRFQRVLILILSILSRSSLMPSPKTYNTAASAWPRSKRLLLVSVLDTPIAKFPINYLESCGDNTWEYVSYVVSLLVEADPLHPGAIIDPEHGNAVDPCATPVAGTFRYIENGTTRERAFGILANPPFPRQNERCPLYAGSNI